MKVTVFRDYKEEHWESMDVYADQLIAGLRRHENKEFTVREFLAFPGASSVLARDSKVLRYVFRFCINPLFARFVQGDINHVIDQANAHLLTVLDPRRTIVTCHDLIVPFWQMHNLFHPSVKKRLKRIFELWRIHFLQRAGKIIAVSNATKNDLVNTLHIQPEKIVVIPEGVDSIYKRISSKAELHRIAIKYKLPQKYILHVGTNYEYKNIQGLLRMFTYLNTKDRNLYLVKTGQAWTNDQLLMIHNMRLGQYIIHCGFVPKNDLPALYSQAQMLLQPSHTEGFGFTVLEAMACGCPVVVSNIPALRELVGEAGVYIEKEEFSKSRNLVFELLKQGQTRSKYCKKGIARAFLYTWDKTAGMTYQVYQELEHANMANKT